MIDYLGEDAENVLRQALGSGDDHWTKEAIHGLTIKCHEKNGIWVKWIVYRSDQEGDDGAGAYGEGASLAEAVKAYLADKEARADG